MKYKLVCFDMDGTIFEHRNFWMELHKKFGTHDEGKKLTEMYVRTDYAKLVDEVVGKLWKGKDAKPYHDLIDSVRYIAGAKETIAELAGWNDKSLSDPAMDHIMGAKDAVRDALGLYRTAIISSGPLDLALRAKKELGIDYVFANDLRVVDGKISGDFEWPVANDRKAVILKQLAEDHNLHLSEIIVVGDSESDIKMMRIAGLGIAFCTDSEALKKAANVVVERSDLREILPYILDFEKQQSLKTLE